MAERDIPGPKLHSVPSRHIQSLDPAGIGASPQTPELHARVTHACVVAGQSDAVLHSTHCPAPTQ